MRHLLSAYLNANYFAGYAITKPQVIDMWNAVKAGGTYCPTNMSCGANGWTASQVIAYIQGMYDINADLLSDICKGKQ